jgi:polyhydroxyalkanoate synthase
MPVFNVYATEDHLVPPAASIALENYVGTKDYTAFAFKGGHIGIYVSGRAQKEIPAAVAKWLQDRAH